MGIFDDLKAKGAEYRLTEEALYAEVLREIEGGKRRDGLWAKAMADAGMDEAVASAAYIKMRVQSLKDEITLLMAEKVRSEPSSQQPSWQSPQISSSLELQKKAPRLIVGATQGGACGVVGYLLFAYRSGIGSTFQFDAVAFFFFMVAGALVGLAFSRKS